MTPPAPPSMPKLPFVVADVMLLAAAAGIVAFSARPLSLSAAALCTFCVAAAAWAGILPFLMEYRAAVKAFEAESLGSAIDQINQVHAAAQKIESATAQWVSVHERAQEISTAANAIAQRMATETQSFMEFMQKSNDAEKKHLRVEVEKLRRVEGEWLQILTRVLDHIYALSQAGERSGQPALIEQLNHFQNACRDIARRVGLVPFVPLTGEAFDEKLHQIVDGKVSDNGARRIRLTAATGYMYQGQLLRRAVVVVEREPETGPESEPKPQPEPASPAPSEPSVETAAEPVRRAPTLEERGDMPFEPAPEAETPMAEEALESTVAVPVDSDTAPESQAEPQTSEPTREDSEQRRLF